MSKARRTTKSKPKDDGTRVTPVTEQPASQRVECPKCPSCSSANTRVYATRKPLRYGKCGRCGFTWSFAITHPAPGNPQPPVPPSADPPPADLPPVDLSLDDA